VSERARASEDRERGAEKEQAQRERGVRGREREGEREREGGKESGRERRMIPAGRGESRAVKKREGSDR